MTVEYLTLEQAIALHARTVAVSGGGSLGHLDTGKLQSVLEHIQNDEYYPEFADKLTHLLFATCKFHCFVDGNKRIAIVLCLQMLLNNGYLLCASSFLRDTENISYHVAAGRIDKAFLREYIGALIEGNADDEDLKLRLLHAISE